MDKNAYWNGYFARGKRQKDGVVVRNLKTALSRAAIDLRKLVGPGEPVVDVGGGQGDFLSDAFPEYANRTVVDVSKEALVTAAARGLKIATCDLENESIPLPDRSARLVIFCEVAEHLAETSRALDEIKRILAPNGYVLISTPNAAGLSSRIRVAAGMTCTSQSLDPSHIRFFTAKNLRAAVECAGFTVVRRYGTPALAPDPFGGLVNVPLVSDLAANLGEHLIFLAKKV